jgi:uncharacterized protein YndB with AHSA1/START domain
MGKSGGGSALPAGREIAFRKRMKVDAPPEAIYELLADVRSHLEWGGNRGKKNFRLTGVEVGETPAREGTEWTSTGIAPDGTFRDRSIVIEASHPSVFEFHTDAHVSFKKGGEGDWKIVNRYEVRPEGAGSLVTYTQRVTHATVLGPMKMLLNPILAGVGRMMVGGLVKPAMQNLASMAKERAGKG